MPDDVRKLLEQGFNPYSPEFLTDPYPYYHALREHAPVYRHPTGHWMLTRYKDCAAALHEPQWRWVDDFGCLPDKKPWSSEHETVGPRTVAVPQRSDLSASPANEGVDYATLRKPLGAGFTPRAVRRLQPRIQQIVDDLIDAARAKAEVNLVEEIGNPLTVTAFGSLFGIPESDYGLIRRCLDTLFIGGSSLFTAAPAEEDERRDHAAEELRAYFGELVAERRRQPRDDVLSSLSAAVAGMGEYADRELVATCIITMTAGYDTTTSLIASGVLTLIRNPAQLARLRAAPDTAANAIEEMLRYESPAQFIARAAREDIEIDGQRIGRDELAVLCLGAANRDPEVFPDPDVFDITRANAHLAFGDGAHFCPGAALARLEARIFFETLLRKTERFELAGTPVYRPSFIVRGFLNLPIALA